MLIILQQVAYTPSTAISDQDKPPALVHPSRRRPARDFKHAGFSRVIIFYKIILKSNIHVDFPEISPLKADLENLASTYR